MVTGDEHGTHIPFHLIGQLQSNKIGKVLPVVNTIESVDSVDSAEKISRRAVARGIAVGVLLEVNESGEASKSGYVRYISEATSLLFAFSNCFLKASLIVCTLAAFAAIFLSNCSS